MYVDVIAAESVCSLLISRYLSRENDPITGVFLVKSTMSSEVMLHRFEGRAAKRMLWWASAVGHQPRRKR